MHPLRRVPLSDLEREARRLLRRGELTGHAALAFAIWPDPADLLAYVEARRREARLERQAAAELGAYVDGALAIRRAIGDRNARVPLQAKLVHAYRAPLKGLCVAYVDLGPRWRGKVHCSRRAALGDYCRTHARKVAALTRAA